MKWIVLLLSCACYGAPFGEWVETTPPQEAPSNFGVDSPLVGVDGSCNAVAVWIDNGQIEGARLSPCGTIWIPTTTIAAAGGGPITSIDFKVAPNGDAVVVYASGGNTPSVAGAWLPATSTTWTSIAPNPMSTNTATEPAVAVNAACEFLAVWVEAVGAGSAPNTVRGAFLDKNSSSWVYTEQASVEGRYGSPQVSLNDCGDAVAVWQDLIFLEVVGARLMAGSLHWESTGKVPTGAALPVFGTESVSMALDCSGRAVVVVEVTDGSSTWIVGATLPRREYGWVAADAPLSSGPSDESPLVAVGGPNCRAVAVWQDAEEGVINGAVLPFGSNGWIATSALSSPTVFASEPALAMDRGGNAIAVWNAGNFDIQGAVLAETSTIWTATNNLNETEGDTVSQPAVAISPNGQTAVGVWLDTNGNETQVLAARNCTPFVPYPVEHLFVEQVANTFASQVEFINRLFWTASPSSGVVAYRIYRDGNEIGLVSSKGGLVFEDHNQKEGVSHVYAVVAISANGKESEAKMVNLEF